MSADARHLRFMLLSNGLRTMHRKRGGRRLKEELLCVVCEAIAVNFVLHSENNLHFNYQSKFIF